jgi:outer membrane biosynthesis protein TonB
MTSGHNAVARRVLGAVLLSIALHALLLSAFKPLSARYGGEQFLRVHLNTANASLQAASPGRAPTLAERPAVRKREPSAAPRVMPEDANLARSYLSGAQARAGNLPDGREAYVELDMRLLSQYYTASEVDHRAIALEEPPLYNPLHGPEPGFTARVVLLVLVNENGGVDGVATLQSRYRGPYDAIARAAFASIRFSPATKDGKPVKSQKVIEVIYGS